MSKIIYTTSVLTGLVCLAVLIGGCSGTNGAVGTTAFSTGDVLSIEVDYDGELIALKESDSDQITVVEYIDHARKAYQAKIELSQGVLSISEGARPIGNGVHAHIELYLPSTYRDNISLHTSDGGISVSFPLRLTSFHAESTNGAILCSDVTADEIYLSGTAGTLTLNRLSSPACVIDTTNANTVIDGMTGTLEYESKGGNLTLTNASGSGRFQATGDGGLTLSFTEVAGNICAYTKNGDLTLTLPEDYSFLFSARTRAGRIQSSFSNQLISTNTTADGTVGQTAGGKVDLETQSGDINVVLAR